MDDNKQIISIIDTILQSITTSEEGGFIQKSVEDRLDLGRKRYGHGVRVNADVSQWSQSKEDSWLKMADEEFYDGLVYLAAARIRRMNKKENIEHIDTAMKHLIRGIKAIHS